MDTAEQPAVNPECPAAPVELAGHPRYQVIELLGSGGMGKVFRAKHKMLGREVVLKTLRRELTNDAKVVRRFIREAKAASKLNHPNVVTVIDADQVNGLHFLVMDFVEGTDLWQLVARNGPMPAADAAECIRQAAIGMQHIHELGLVHRDVKPSNLMLTPKGQVKVLDLGLVLAPEEPGEGGGQLTTRRTVLGTAEYSAPEQFGDSHAVDIRADIYGLGASYFHLLSGHPPYPDIPSEKFILIMQAHMTKPFPDLRRLRPDVPEGAIKVLDKMVAKAPEDRYATPAEVAEALAPFCAGADLPARAAADGQWPKVDAPASGTPTTAPRTLAADAFPVGAAGGNRTTMIGALIAVTVLVWLVIVYLLVNR